jgi:REP element-mobilizing transposase RayT
MSQPLRIEYPDAWYHVMNRGQRAEDVFVDDSDYNTFLGLLRDGIELWNVRRAAYCLMQNHYHLLVQTPDANLSRSMRHINGVYTQRFNRHHLLRRKSPKRFPSRNHWHLPVQRSSSLFVNPTMCKWRICSNPGEGHAMSPAMQRLTSRGN